VERETEQAVEREVRIDASPEVVFQYFVDPARMVQWKGTDAALDARPAGIYRVSVTGRDIARGEYLEVVPHSRIVFTWGWEGSPIPPGSTTVEVTLTPDGSGTLLRLRHLGLTDAESREQHAVGWDHFLPRLVIAAAGGDPGPDPWLQGPPQDITHAPNP
jgi:uncharacterized protein YndB with AHSA1/START domain